MPVETQLPDALLENSGFASIALADIDEDPDAPDASWAAASSNNNATIARVGFPTPTGNPSGVQTFKMYVRQNALSGSGTPTARIDLYENGTLLASGSDQNVTSLTGQMLSQNFDLAATPLTMATGADVEARFVGTQSGGSPSARSSVDLGAINWDTVNYTTELVYAKTGVVVSDAAAAAADMLETTETGVVVAPSVAAATDVYEAVETGLVVIGEIGGGITYQKTGAAVFALSAAATDEATFTETGAGVSVAAAAAADTFEATEAGQATSAAVASGASSSVSTYEKTGTVVSAAAAAGVDAFTAAEAGTAISAVSSAGVSVYQPPGGATYTKTGAAISAASLAGADSYQAVEAGAAVTAGSAAGADANIYSDLGTVLSAFIASGPAVYQPPGAAVVAASVSVRHTTLAAVSVQDAAGAHTALQDAPGATVAVVDLVPGLEFVFFYDEGAYDAGVYG